MRISFKRSDSKKLQSFSFNWEQNLTRTVASFSSKRKIRRYVQNVIHSWFESCSSVVFPSCFAHESAAGCSYGEGWWRKGALSLFSEQD